MDLQLTEEQEEAKKNEIRKFLCHDYIFNFGTAVILYSLWISGYLPCRFGLSHLFGTLFGLILWETPNAIVPCFRLVSREVEETHFKLLYVLAHSISDGTIVLFLYTVAQWIFNDPRFKKFYAKLLFFVLANLQAVLVELVFNGKIWEYRTDLFLNPIMFSRKVRIGERRNKMISYTLWPQLVWLITSASFIATFPYVVSTF